MREDAATTPSKAGLWVGVLAGFPLIAFGVRGALMQANRTQPRELAEWVVGAAVVHDLVLIPVVTTVGWLLHRAVRRPSVWWAVRSGLLTAAVLTLVGWPFVRGYGRRPDLPSALARNYGAGLLTFLGAVAAITTLAALVASRGGAARGPGGRGAPPLRRPPSSHQRDP